MALKRFRALDLPDYSANQCITRNVGGENPSLGSFVRFAEKNAKTEHGGESGSTGGNDLAFSNLRWRFRPFAGVCRFLHFIDTRNEQQRSFDKERMLMMEQVDDQQACHIGARDTRMVPGWKSNSPVSQVVI